MTRRRRRRSPPVRRFWIALLVLLAAVAAAVWLLRPPRRPSLAPAGGEPDVSAPESADSRPAPLREATRVEPAERPAPTARVALVLDDLGRSVPDADRLLGLGVPVAAAVLPFEPRSAEVAKRLREGGAELLVHLPMEPLGSEDPGPNAVLEGQGRRRITRLTGQAIDAIPGAVGLNNHMGSRTTADPRVVAAILGVVAERGLYFFDSRTTAESLGFEEARRLGIPSVRRDVFLDVDPSAEAVGREFRRLLALGRKRGAAVAIGHPHPATFEVLEREVPAARSAGVEFVPLSYLLERSESFPE